MIFRSPLYANEEVLSDSSGLKFTFLQFSDVHVGHPINRPVHKRLQAAVQLANNSQAAFVIDSGDMTNHPVYEASETNLAEFAEYRKYMAALEMPLYLLPGNHDIGYFDPQGDTHHGGKPWGDYQELVSVYRKEMGPLDQSFEYKGVRFILVNNNPARSGGPGFLSDKQLAWVERQLKSSSPAFLFCHVPLFARTTGKPWGKSSRQLIDLCEKYGVAAVGYGHEHPPHAKIKEIAGTRYIMCPDLKVPGHESVLRYRVFEDHFELCLVDVFSRRITPVGSYRYPLRPDPAKTNSTSSM